MYLIVNGKKRDNYKYKTNISSQYKVKHKIILKDSFLYQTKI